MQIPVQQFPILTPGQMNPFNQALQSGLATYGDIMKSAYLRPKMESDINYKNALSTYQPYNYLLKAMSDPLVYSSWTDEEKQRASSILSHIPIRSGIGNQANQQSSGDGPLSTVWNSLKSMFGGGDEQADSFPQNNVTAYLQQNPQAAEEFKRTGEYVIPGASSSVTSSPSASVPAPKNDLYTAAVASKFPLSQQGMNLGAKKKGTEQQAVGDVKIDQSLWENRIKSEGEDVNALQQTIDTLGLMKQQYKDTPWYQKGVVFGHAPAVTAAAQTLDTLAKTQSTNFARATQSGHITNTDFLIFDKIKSNRAMNAKTFNDIVNYNQALAQREKQHALFDAEARENQMSVQQADKMWSKFINSHPLFDSKTFQVNKENITLSPFDAGSSSNKIPPAAKLLSKQINIPDFNSKTEYQAWFNQQPEVVQHAIREKLRGR